MRGTLGERGAVGAESGSAWEALANTPMVLLARADRTPANGADPDRDLRKRCVIDDAKGRRRPRRYGLPVHRDLRRALRVLLQQIVVTETANHTPAEPDLRVPKAT